MIESTMLAFAVIVFLSYAVQTVTGFGSMLLCVTFGAHLLPIKLLVTLAVPISLLQTGYIVIRHRDGIRFDLLLKRILPLMGIIGVPVGYALSNVAGDELRVVFGVMVGVLASRELWVLTRPGDFVDGRTNPLGASLAALVGAGIIHGIYATGGPLLVYAMGREGLPKHEFRSTLSAVWLVLNAGLAVAFLLDGRFDPQTTSKLLVLLPAVPLGIALGEFLHSRVDELRFKKAVFSLLIAAAVSLIVR